MSVPHQVAVPKPLAPAAIAKMAGVQVMENNGKRVRVLFTPEARKAADEAKHVDYVERVAASDNLRWTLSAGDAQAATRSRSAPRPRHRPRQLRRARNKPRGRGETLPTMTRKWRE